MRVLLTGGSGLVGSHVAELLAERGHGVVALRRPGSRTSHLRSTGAVVVKGDVRDAPGRIAGAVTSAAGGVDAVVHAAAVIYADAPWPRVREVNVRGTANVVAAAGAAGATAGVHVSSIAVYGALREGTADESSPTDTPLRPGDLYARSKREAEAAAVRAAGSAGMRLAVVRPSVVYGERDRLFSPTVARIVSLPVVPLLGSGENTVPVVYAGNVAAGIAAALERGVDGRAYDLALDRPLTQRELVEGMARGMGVDPRFIRIPRGLARAAARVGDALDVPVPGAGEVPPGRVARLALDDNPYTSRRAREELGWEPPHRHADALRRTGRWLARRRRKEERS